MQRTLKRSPSASGQLRPGFALAVRSTGQSGAHVSSRSGLWEGWPALALLALFMGGVGAAPARAMTTTISTAVTGPITVNVGDQLNIVAGGAVTVTSGFAVTVAGGTLNMSGALCPRPAWLASRWPSRAGWRRSPAARWRPTMPRSMWSEEPSPPASGPSSCLRVAGVRAFVPA
jgi:hypothetical protein